MSPVLIPILQGVSDESDTLASQLLFIGCILIGHTYLRQVATDWDSYIAELKKYEIIPKEKVSGYGNVNLYYCKGKFEFWSQKLHENLARYPLECYFLVKRRNAEAHKKTQSPAATASNSTQQASPVSAATHKTESKPHVQKPIVIPPLPFEFLWDVPQSDETAYRRGETVYTFAPNQLTGIRHTIGYGITSRPESRNAA